MNCDDCHGLKGDAKGDNAVELLLPLLLIGLLAGWTGGLLGVGGSIVMIPALTEVFGPNQHVYQAAAMIVNFFVVVPAVYHHASVGAVDRKTVARLLPLAVVAVVTGVVVSELPLFANSGERYLRGLFGLFLLSICAADLYGLARPSAPKSVAPPGSTQLGWRSSAVVALPTGLVAGLLGVGGGVLAVPLQRRFLGVPIRNAIANSATVIIATSVIGATIKNYAMVTTHAGGDGDGTDAFVIAACLAPTAMVGSAIGSRLTHRLPVRAIKVAFFILLAVAAVRLTLGALLSPA